MSDPTENDDATHEPLSEADIVVTRKWILDHGKNFAGLHTWIALCDSHEALRSRLVELERAHDALRQDAERWRWFKQFLTVEDDVQEGGQYLFLWDNRISDVTFLHGFDNTVDSLVDLRMKTVVPPTEDAARLSDTPHDAPSPTEAAT